MRFVRRYWLQLGGVVVALVLVGVLSLIAFRGSGSGGSSAVQTTTTRAATTPTPDPRVEQVKAAVRTFIAADEQSAKTGDPAPLHALTEPGSAADSNAGATATTSRIEHKNFMSDRVDYVEASWRVDITGSSAIVDIDYALHGHDAKWPSLEPLDSDHEGAVLHARFELRLADGRWLLTSIA